MEGSERNELERELKLIKGSRLIEKMLKLKKKLWESELMQRLELINKLENREEEEEVKRKLREPGIPEYAFIKEAYMGLPLPLPIRVHRYFELYYSIVIEISLILAILAVFSHFSWISAINPLKLVMVVIVSIVVSIITFLYLRRKKISMKYEARVFKEIREPKK